MPRKRCPRATDSKAASAPTPSGFAFVPQYVPCSWTASVGLSNRGEVMRQTSPSSSPFRSKDAGRLSPMGKHSVCAQGLQMLMGFIHNRQRINRAKECPDRGTFVGAWLWETPFGDEERISQ